MRIPDLLVPLVAKGVTRLPEQVLTFWRDSLLLTFDPGTTQTLTYTPRAGHVYLIIGITMGKVRDFATGDTLTTDDYGFKHRHGQMRWHTDYGVESVYEFTYPQWLEVTTQDPLEMEFFNNSALKIIQDFSIWIYDCGVEQWRDHVLPYLKGLYRLAYDKGLEK